MKPLTVVVIVALLASVKSSEIAPTLLAVNAPGLYATPSQADDVCEYIVPDQTVPFPLPACAIKKVALPAASQVYQTGNRTQPCWAMFEHSSLRCLAIARDYFEKRASIERKNCCVMHSLLFTDKLLEGAFATISNNSDKLPGPDHRTGNAWPGITRGLRLVIVRITMHDHATTYHAGWT